MESSSIVVFRKWIMDHGGSFHPNAVLAQASNGCGLVAREDIQGNEEVVSCPFELAITGPASQATVSQLLNLKGAPKLACRQWICIYIVLHWIVGKSSDASRYLRHFPYLDLLPFQGELITALYFTSQELEAFKGTNLYGACNDRLHEWQTEWMQSREVVSQYKPEWGIQFEWSLYLAASTYISSRAFPSTVLSQTPQLPNLDDDDTPSDPVLLPGVDILNHARGQPVTWVSHTKPQAAIERVAIVPHRSTPAGQEIFNNYGPKPNAELILGYGFTLPNNPDDTIILKLGGGIEGRKWSVGRNATGVEGLWKEILSAVGGNGKSEAEGDFETILDASGALGDMISTMYERLPEVNALQGKAGVRPQVARMYEHYVEGQRAILESLIQYARGKEEEAVELAHSRGVELVLED